MAPLTARKLVLDLVTARPTTVFTMTALCRAAEVVGLSEASVRMAATRLADEGIVRRTGRGAYRLHAEHLSTFGHVEHWRTRTHQTVAWNGRWVGADLSQVPRADRTTRRRVERELRLAGMAPWRGTISLRPDNLRGGVDQLRHRLPSELAVFAVSELHEDDEAAARSLWDCAALAEQYARLRAELRASVDESAHVDSRAFARESLLLGSRAIAAIVRDPLLPGELCSPDPLSALIADTADYQDRAQDTWAALLWDEGTAPD